MYDSLYFYIFYLYKFNLNKIFSREFRDPATKHQRAEKDGLSKKCNASFNKNYILLEAYCLTCHFNTHIKLYCRYPSH